MECTEKIEGREDEKSQAHALCFVGGVGVWEVGFQAAEPVSDVLFFVQGSKGGRDRHYYLLMLRMRDDSMRGLNPENDSVAFA